MKKKLLIGIFVLSTCCGYTQNFTTTYPGYIGINTDTPTNFLTIEGNEPVGETRNFLKIFNRSYSGSSLAGLEIASGPGYTKTMLQHHSSTWYYPGLEEYTDFGQLFSRGAGLILRTGSLEKPDGVIKFMTGVSSVGGSLERMRIASNGKIGIGTKNPTNALTIEGNEPEGDGRSFIKIHNSSNSSSSISGMELSSGWSSAKTLLQHVSSSWYYPGLEAYAGFGQLYSRGAGLILRAGSPEYPFGVIKFMTGNTYVGGSEERMRVAANGNVGIGTQYPGAKLQVTQGDVYVENADRGIILRSPNGACWRVTIDNYGNFVRNHIECP